MSMDNAVKFYEKVKADQGLQQKISQAAKENPQAMAAIIIKTAKEIGFEFSEEELKAFMAEKAKTLTPNGELNDNELEMVAGGGKFDKVLQWLNCSVCTAGIGCVLSGIDHARGSSNCHDLLGAKM